MCHAWTKTKFGHLREGGNLTSTYDVTVASGSSPYRPMVVCPAGRSRRSRWSADGSVYFGRMRQPIGRQQLERVTVPVGCATHGNTGGWSVYTSRMQFVLPASERWWSGGIFPRSGGWWVHGSEARQMCLLRLQGRSPWKKRREVRTAKYRTRRTNARRAHRSTGRSYDDSRIIDEDSSVADRPARRQPPLPYTSGTRLLRVNCEG